MPKRLDLAGKTFGNCKFISHATDHVTSGGFKLRRAKWLCLRCGKVFVTKVRNVVSGHTTSCGCYRDDNRHFAHLTHGHSVGKTSRTYNAWVQIRDRCYNPNNLGFKNYGGRGITVCKEWRDSFERFLADMGPCPEGMEIDRIKNDEGYCLSNCRWTSRQKNSRNKRTNRVVTVGGKTGCLIELCEFFGVNYRRTIDRLNYGWSPEAAFLTPRLKPGVKVFRKPK